MNEPVKKCPTKEGDVKAYTAIKLCWYLDLGHRLFALVHSFMSAACWRACVNLNIALSSSLFLCDSPVRRAETLGRGKKINKPVRVWRVGDRQDSAWLSRWLDLCLVLSFGAPQLLWVEKLAAFMLKAFQKEGTGGKYVYVKMAFLYTLYFPEYLRCAH